jgi:hypothetical protein
MRKYLAKGVIWIAIQVAAQVVQMMYPSIKLGTGWRILAACATAVLVGILLLIPEIRRWWKEQREPKSDLPNPAVQDIALSIRCEWGTTEEDLATYQDSYIWDIKNVASMPVSMHALIAWKNYYKTKVAQVYKYVITNHSEKPLFDIRLPVLIQFWDTENAENLDGNRPPPETSAEVSLPISDRALKPNQEIVFFINSVSVQHVEVLFRKYAVAELTNSQQKITIPVKSEHFTCQHAVFFAGGMTLHQWLAEGRDVPR